MAAQLAIAAASGTSKPLLGEKEEPPTMNPVTGFKRWLCSSPLEKLPLVALVSLGIFCLVVPIVGLNYLITAVIGTALLGGGAYHIWTLRSLSEQVDRFSYENGRLEETASRLENEVAFLGTKKDELTGHVTKLEGTVGDLKNVSEGLQNELTQFESVQKSLEKFAADAGGGLEDILGNANKLYGKLQTQAAQNEKALLSKIAQDLEFLDKDVGMSKEEFGAFMERVPKHLRERFVKRNMSFEKIAGDDGVVDFMEIEEMITTLMEENVAKLEGVTVES